MPTGRVGPSASTPEWATAPDTPSLYLLRNHLGLKAARFGRGLVEAVSTVRVRELYLAVDAGQVINPDGLRNQVEGAQVKHLACIDLPPPDRVDQLEPQPPIRHGFTLGRGPGSKPFLSIDGDPMRDADDAHAAGAGRAQRQDERVALLRTDAGPRSSPA